MGLQQCKQKNSLKQLNDIINEDIDLTQTRECFVYCKELATKIQTNFWVLVGQKYIDRYKKKIGSLKLNLLDPKNSELRLNILNGTIDPSKLPLMSPKDLAPKIVKEKRQNREKAYFEEQVLLKPAQENMVLKSHKGQDVILHEELRKQQNFNMRMQQNEQLLDIINKQAETPALNQNNDDDLIEEDKFQQQSDNESVHTLGMDMEEDFPTSKTPPFNGSYDNFNAQQLKNDWEVELSDKIVQKSQVFKQLSHHHQKEEEKQKEDYQTTQKDQSSQTLKNNSHLRSIDKNESSREEQSKTRQQMQMKQMRIRNQKEQKLFNQISSLTGIKLYESLKARSNQVFKGKYKIDQLNYLESVFEKEISIKQQKEEAKQKKIEDEKDQELSEQIFKEKSSEF